MKGDTTTAVKVIAAKQLTTLYSKQAAEQVLSMDDKDVRDALREAMQLLPADIDGALADLLVSPDVIRVVESLFGFADAMYTELLNSVLEMIVSGDIADGRIEKAMRDYNLFSLFAHLMARVVELNDGIGETED